MPHMSMAGQIAERLEWVLEQAKRDKGLYGLPAAHAQCFFEDPLGPSLQDAAPRCPPDPLLVYPNQPLWHTLAFGTYPVPNASRDLSLFDIVGNGGRYDLAKAAQWCFLHWLHCYQNPVARYDGFYNVLLHRQHRQRAPYGRIWTGFAITMAALAVRASDLTGVLAPPLPVDYGEQLNRHEYLPGWLDALGRLGPYHDAAHDRFSVQKMFGAKNIADAVDWHWESAPANSPRPPHVRDERVSPANYRRLVHAMTLDRWMSVELNLMIEADGSLRVGR